jgi:hypothetical protein
MSPCSWFLVLVWVFWLPLMLAVAAADDCSEKRMCGNLTISQPFWLSDIRRGSCGLLDFQVTCNRTNNLITPILRTSTPFGFAIIDIHYDERILLVVDLHKQEQLHDYNSCHVPIVSSSDKLAIPFRIDPRNLYLVMYNCTAPAAKAAARRVPEVVPMRCGNESSAFVRVGGYYNGSANHKGYSIEGCNETVVPVLGSPPGAANASDYERLVGDGFLLTWDPFPG